MSKPGIILTSKYSLPDSKDFNTYVNYLTREKALLEKDSLSISETDELKRMNLSKSLLFDSISSGEFEMPQNGSKLQREANKVLNSDFDFDNVASVDFTKMVSYMARSYALDQKDRLTSSEKKEKEAINNGLNKIISNSNDELMNGVFDMNRNFIQKSDLDDVKDKFLNSQKHGSVMYQDVISFDTKFLKKNGLIDNKNNLDEDRLKDAAQGMMQKMFDLEDMKDTGYWFASIHRNTQHVHIHFASIESENTRKIVEVTNKNGSKVLEPKGKRKLSTLDKMKTTFANELLDRNDSLQRISELRNNLVSNIKQNISASQSDKKTVHLMNDLYSSLPKEKKKWNYGGDKRSKNQISDDSRKILDKLTIHLIKNDPEFSEYNKLIREESNFNKNVYGESKREDKDYENNKRADILKRLGNSTLKELKSMDKTQQARVTAFNKVSNKSINFKHDTRRFSLSLSKKISYTLKKSIREDVQHAKAIKFYESMQKEAERGY